MIFLVWFWENAVKILKKWLLQLSNLQILGATGVFECAESISVIKNPIRTLVDLGFWPTILLVSGEKPGTWKLSNLQTMPSKIHHANRPLIGAV
jgi:hypothetical protein